MKWAVRIATALTVLILLLSATGGAVMAAPIQRAGQVFHSIYLAKEYSFSGPSVLPAGWNQITLFNKGKEWHQAQFIRLDDGKTMNDLLEAMASEEATLPGWATFYGGPNSVEPKMMASATVYLPAGKYALVCDVPDENGNLHVAMGMYKTITVQSLKQKFEGEPQATAFVTQNDFYFEVNGSIKPGLRTFRVDNLGAQVHEVAMIRLNPGATLEDLEWAMTPGSGEPLPGKAVGGITGLQPGMHQYFEVLLVPGNYVLLDLFTDPDTGYPNAALGMVTVLTVKYK